MRSAVLVLLVVTSTAYADAPSPAPITIDEVFDGQGGPSGTAQTAPDVGGAAGSEQVVDVVSGFVTIRDAATHQVLTSSTADAFWSAAGVIGTPAAFAQRAAFNATNQRWYISAEEATTSGTPNRIYLAVSASGDARGPWKAVTLPVQANAIANTQLAVDACGAYLTGDTGGSGVVMALPFADLEWTNGNAPSAAHLNVLPAIAGVVPAIDAWNQIGSDARMFVARDNDGITKIDLFRLHWASSLCSSTLTATLDAPASVSLGTTYARPTRAAVQPSPAPGLAAGSGAIASAVSSNGTIVGIMTTEIGGQLAAAWFQLYADPSNSAPPELQQTAAIVDPSADLIVPAIAFDSYNGIGVVLVRTSPTVPPSIYITAQVFGDFPGTMRPLMPVRIGTAPYSCTPTAGVSTFGRYSSISSTATGFWAVAQYGASTVDCAFGTAWVNFGVQVPSLHDPGFGGDDPGHSDGQLHLSGGCGGCSSQGDAAPSIACFAAVALVLRIGRRRDRR
ncbi:MAG TPA: MYXO-CTERM sorting domain-containing protein [Kofleriaceae bacterium]